MNDTEKAEALRRLEARYGVLKPALEYGSDFELLVAVMLSAQCTDKRVNIVTRELFAQGYNTPGAMAVLEPEQLEPMIRSCGLAPSKAKNIVAASKILVSEYGGKIPQDITLMQKLPGVGRKTANVVGSVAFGIPAIAVDTHVFRVSNRLGLANEKNVEKTELALQRAIPKQKWSLAHHWLIWLGRGECSARKPECADCFLNDICDYNREKN